MQNTQPGKLEAEAVSMWTLTAGRQFRPLMPRALCARSKRPIKGAHIHKLFKNKLKMKTGTLCPLYVVNFCCSHVKRVELFSLISIRAVLSQALMMKYFGNLNGERLQPWEVGK